MKRILLFILIFSAIASAGIRDRYVYDGTLLAHWKLDDPNGTTVKDSFGTNTGTPETPTHSANGVLNSCILFDGTDDGINCGSASAIDDIFVGGATVACWFLSDGRGENDVGRAMNKDTWYIDMRLDTTHMRFTHNFAGDNGAWRFTIVSGIWQHLAIVYDNALILNNPIVYLNGVSVTIIEEVTPTVSDGDADTDAANDFYIGDSSISNACWDGQIDDVRLFSSELTASQVRKLYKGSHWRLGRNR